ncbi:unnamed protein product [Linum trigynum]|uniref:Uncharacterized protein n=1 Tax=Linum trigynum TaxID=586398 RepID=A0AAV2GU25_9ROSI
MGGGAIWFQKWVIGKEALKKEFEKRDRKPSWEGGDPRACHLPRGTHCFAAHHMVFVRVGRHYSSCFYVHSSKFQFD